MDCLLFVDDDKNILRINKDYFEKRGFAVYVASCFDEAVECITNSPVDCAVLDILLPGNDGLSLCERIRKTRSIPIIFLTSLSQKDFLYRGFTAGGDDYMTKPYDLLELEMRILAAMKRSRGIAPPPQILEFPPLTIDADSHTVLADGAPVPLTAYEFDILYLLASSAGKVFSSEYIYRTVWQLPDINNVATVQVHLARLRHKLETACPGRSFLGTVWKKGYKFTPDGKKETVTK